MRRWLLAGLMLAVALPAPAEQVLRKGNEVEPETLDPHKAEGVSAANILRDLYEGLTSEAPGGDVVPGAAERWEVSDDGLAWVFHLRADGRWSNGDPVVAEDFVAGLRRAVDPRTGSNFAQILAPIENAEAVIAGALPPRALGVRALDDRRVEIRLKGPTPYLLGLLNHATSYPIHRPSLARHGERFARAGTLVGNGAYVLSEWVVQSHATLVRNPHYWDAEGVAIDRVVYYPIENQASELKRYRAGELDWTEQVPYSQLDWIRRNLAGELHIAPYLGIYYFGLNVTRPPFRDAPKLRKALALALDRETLTARITGAGELPAYNWVPPGTANYEPVYPEWQSWTRPQRLEEARRLYAEAGYSADRPLELELRYNTQENHKKIAITAAFMWREALGVRTRLVNEEWKVFLQNRRFRRVTQAFRAVWVSDYNDPFSFFELLQSHYGMNDTGYASPAYDALVAQAAATADPARRLVLLQAAERILLEDLPVIPVYMYVTKRLVKPYVTGWQPNIMDHHYTKHFRLLPH